MAMHDNSQSRLHGFVTKLSRPKSKHKPANIITAVTDQADSRRGSSTSSSIGSTSPTFTRLFSEDISLSTPTSLTSLSSRDSQIRASSLPSPASPPSSGPRKKMTFRQRVARHFDTVSTQFSSEISATPFAQEENVKMVAGDNDNKSENGNGANTEATVKARSLNNADKVGKRSGGVMEEHKRRRKTARQVIRHTRSSSRLTSNEQLSPQDPVLSYHDVLLTHEDIKALKNDWLTDNNIAFWEEWLEREILPKYPQANICLLRPSMSFLLMKTPDLSSIKGNLPNFHKVTHIFMPINDARSVETAEGGSHWSLLLVSAIDGVAFHYDSLSNCNYKPARDTTDKFSKILGIPLRFHNIEDCPQQDNSNDCGVFVCILMRHLLVKRLLNANAREKVSMSMANKMIDSHGGRKEMLKIIESLRKEGERRRSASPFPSSRSPPRIE